MKRRLSILLVVILVLGAVGVAIVLKGTLLDQKKAVSLDELRGRALQGDAEAQNKLGAAYYNGTGVGKDIDEALRWFRTASDKGYARAQYNLAILYYQGDGVERDYQEALRWFDRAARQGLAEAQYNIGVMYADGLGVQQDKAQAAGWYTRAAQSGYVLAQYNLGLMYYEGQGVLKDTTLAFTWLSLAADQGFADAAKNRDFVAARMTAEQKAVAGKRLDEWRARKKGKRWWKPAFFTGITSLRP